MLSQARSCNALMLAEIGIPAQIFMRLFIDALARCCPKGTVVSPPVSRVLLLLTLIRLFIWTDRCRSVHATYHCDGAKHPMPSAWRLAFHSFGLAPGGVYHAWIIADPAVRSYRTLSPLPPLKEMRVGGLLSVALSLGSPPPGVTRHLCSVVPGLSSPAHC